MALAHQFYTFSRKLAPFSNIAAKNELDYSAKKRSRRPLNQIWKEGGKKKLAGFDLVYYLRPRLVEYPMAAGGAPDSWQACQLVRVDDLSAFFAYVVCH